MHGIVQILANVFLFCVMSILAVFSHEYASVLLCVSVLAVVASHFMKNRNREAIRTIVAAFPAVTIFLASVFLKIYPVYKVSQPNVLTVF